MAETDDGSSSGWEKLSALSQRILGRGSRRETDSTASDSSIISVPFRTMCASIVQQSTTAPADMPAGGEQPQVTAAQEQQRSEQAASDVNLEMPDLVETTAGVPAGSEAEVEGR